MKARNAILLLLLCVGCGFRTTGISGLPLEDVATAMPIPTATLTPTPTPTRALSLAPTHTHTPVPTSTPTPMPTPLPDPDAQLFAVVDVETDDVLNVREQAGASQPVVGTIPPYGMGVQVTGEGKEVNGAHWVPVRYGDLVGWVNDSYLARLVGWADQAVAVQAVRAIRAIKHKDVEEIAALVHPDRGVRFSPYAYVRAEEDDGQDVVFGAAQVRDLPADPAVYEWGRFDGTGEPIVLTFDAYWARFVYDVDFARPHAIGYGETIGRGNTINNIAQVYPQAVVVEYHLEGFDPAYAGLDWRSLRLVFEPVQGTWYLVGIIHDEWTI
jgi:hypothetical protein